MGSGFHANSAQPEPTPPDDPNRTALDYRPPSPPAADDCWGSGLTRTFQRLPSEESALTIDQPVPEPANLGKDPVESSTPRALGRYVVRSEVGHGGVGVVYEAWDTQLERDVAIKVLRPDHMGKPDVVRRFLEEARITSRLQHPGIVAIHEFGLYPDGRPFFVMRLIRGETLDRILTRRESPSADLPRLLGIFLQFSQAVAYAHSRGVIHRDLKPANIMVGACGEVRVMDWGLAKVLGEPDSPDTLTAARIAARLAQDPNSPASADPVSSETQIGTVFGTPAYLPPEQARGEIDQVDKRADVFGLGAILCEILTGRPPYTGANGHEIYHKAAAADITDAIARVNASAVALDLLSLTKWCLSPDPGNRPVDAAGVVEVVLAYLQANQRRAENDLVRFFDLSLDLFCIASTDGYFLRVNENFPRVLGYTISELTSRQFIDFIHPEDRERTVSEVLRLSSGLPSIRFSNRYRHVDGHYLWIEWNAQAIPEERAIYAVARDVTERVIQTEAHERAEKARFHLAAVVSSADISIISTSLSGKIQSWNHGAERLFGYPAGDAIGRSIGILIPPDRTEEEAVVLSRLTHCERVEHYESECMRADGTRVTVALTVSPVIDDEGNFIGTSKIVRDITERKKAEADAAERLREAAFVSAAGSALTRGASLRESLQDFAEVAVAHLNVAFARVWTLKEQADVLELQASAGLYTHLDGPHSRIPVGVFKIGMIAQERKPHLTNTVTSDPWVSDHTWAVREGMVAFAGHPLMIGNRVVGVMAVFARHPLSSNIIETLRSVSDSLALAIRRHQLEDEVLRLRKNI